MRSLFYLLALGPRPQRELTPTPRRGFTWPRLGLAAGASMALVLALVVSGCSDDPVTPTPTATPASPVTEVFASGLVPLGTSSRTFDAAKAGSVTITLTSSGPPTNVTLGLGVGIPTPGASAGCSLTTAVNTPPGTSPQITVQVDAGKFCVKVFDIAPLTAQTFFSVTIVRP